MTSLTETQTLPYHRSCACLLSSTYNYFTTPIGLCKTFANYADFTECPICRVPEHCSLYPLGYPRTAALLMATI